jgi:serine/threonine-protein kinase
MTDDLRVQQLLDQLLETNATPEEVCRTCPELLPVVRERWRKIRRVRADLDALFPPSDAPKTLPPGAWQETALPRIPGYEVEAVLGRGGMGIVFRARHLRLNRPVALKMMLAGTYAGRREQERFQREAETVAGLHHQNIVQIYDVGDIEGQPYFTMEVVDGGSLPHRLAGTPQPARQAAELVATLAGAVHAAHECGIIHRDLKPANVLLTADGTPKISDFGLARRLEADNSLSISGARVGTPSYMAPEQAAGQSGFVGRPTDVYALGAILYEMLTGRPPFRAESTSETERQVIAEDPVPPSRLNARVPRDLETICLKCLHKDPHCRYATAAALADDVQRYLHGEPISARRPGIVERVGKWVRRHPTAAALIGSTVLFTSVLIGGGLWLAVQQAHRREAIEGDLREIGRLEKDGEWIDARAALQRAEARLDGSGPGDLRRRLSQARRDLDLVMELERIRLNRETSGGDLANYKAKADRQYLAAFDNSCLARAQDPADVVAARVKASAVRVAIFAALDDWAVCTADKDRRDWLLATARAADPDGARWGDRIRATETWDDVNALTKMVEITPIEGQSISLLLALGERLQTTGGNATAFLKRVQQHHPANFWANIALGDALFNVAPAEAASYYRAALASRPGEAVAYSALGDSLRIQSRMDEAIGYYRQALQIDPTYPRAHTNLGNYFKDVGKVDEAIKHFRMALQTDPDYAWARIGLANALSEAGRKDEAIEHYRKYLQIGPASPHIANILRSDLVIHGRGAEVLQDWKKALELDPPNHDDWFGYAELCLFLDEAEEYRRARRDLIRRFGDAHDAGVAEKTARAISLASPTEDELAIAVALADRAVAAKETTPEWIYPYYLFAKGLTEYRQGHFDRAISIMTTDARTAMGPCPRIMTAMSKFRLGDVVEARRMLAAEISACDWSMAQVRSHDQWVWHVVRREAETLIFPDTAAFLEGKYEPHDNTERLALLGVCRFKNRSVALARLYADVFAADPTLAEDLWTTHRYNAARAAAQSGCGQGVDARGLKEQERKRWCDQAREWLRADLRARVRAFDANPTEARDGVHKTLTRWREDPELACVRDPGELEKLGADERKEWLALWAEVAAALAGTMK